VAQGAERRQESFLTFDFLTFLPAGRLSTKQKSPNLSKGAFRKGGDPLASGHATLTGVKIKP